MRLLLTALCLAALLRPGAAQDKPLTGKGVGVRPAATDVGQGQRWALLVGINKYEHMAHLRFCANDMVVLRDALQRHGGYEPQRIHLLSDADKRGRAPTRGNILIALKSFLKQAKPADTVLVAFSGHGATLDKRSYLMPIDGDPSPDMVEHTGLPLRLIHTFLDRCAARQKVLILDACHSGGTRSEKAANKLGADAFAGGSGVLELFSCGVEEESLESEELKQGVFSHFLARGIEGEADAQVAGNGDRRVSADELYAYVHKSVGDYLAEHHGKHRQTPKKRGEVSGLIVLGSRERSGAALGLPDDRLRQRLEQLFKQRRLSDDLHRRAQAWLQVPAEIGPAGDVRLLLSLLAQGSLTEAQFERLARNATGRIESHIQGLAASGQTRVFSVVAGINEYGRKGMDLRGSVPEVRMIRDLVASGDRDESVLLIDAQATRAAFLQAIKRLGAKAGPGDVLVVAFSGQGSSPSSRPVDPKKKDEPWGWLFHRAPSDPGKGPHTYLQPSEFLYALAHCKAHVLVLGLTCSSIADEYFATVGPFMSLDELRTVFSGARAGLVWKAREAENSDLPGGIPTAPARQAARILMGYEGLAYELGVKGLTTLGLLFAQGWNGEADGVLAVNGRGGPDGFVDLAELVAYVGDTERLRPLIKQLAPNRFASTEKIVVQGWLGAQRAVLTKSGLTLD